jgi:hypothetical protein
MARRKTLKTFVLISSKNWASREKGWDGRGILGRNGDKNLRTLAPMGVFLDVIGTKIL